LSRSEGRRTPPRHSEPVEGAAILEAASDLAITVSADGRILKVSSQNGDWPVALGKSWVGQPWTRVVGSDSRPKVDEMLRDAAAGVRQSRWRHLNHLDAAGEEIPILISLVKLEPDGPLIAIGRDLRAVASLQARLIESQQRLEADYLQLRRAESQYRLLLDIIRDPILIIQQPGHAILEVNRAACQFFGLDRDTLLSRTLDGFLNTRSAAALRIMFEQVSGSGRPAEMSLRFSSNLHSAHLFASSMRQEGDTVILLRLETEAAQAVRGDNAAILEAVRQLSDGIVTTDSKGVILSANPAFVEMVQMAHAGQLTGEPLSRWLGRAHTDLTVLINSLAQGGTIRLFSTRLVGVSGIAVPVEISGVAIASDDEPYLAFVIRDTGRRLGEERESSAVTRSGGDLAALVGRMPLKDIVGETVDLIERLCIEAALKITRNNRASAADMLGLSRQSLYVKLRRYGIEGPDLDNPSH
jgi:transcriptional regulator PpsR